MQPRQSLVHYYTEVEYVPSSPQWKQKTAQGCDGAVLRTGVAAGVCGLCLLEDGDSFWCCCLAVSNDSCFWTPANCLANCCVKVVNAATAPCSSLSVRANCAWEPTLSFVAPRCCFIPRLFDASRSSSVLNGNNSSAKGGGLLFFCFSAVLKWKCHSDSHDRTELVNFCLHRLLPPPSFHSKVQGNLEAQ